IASEFRPWPQLWLEFARRAAEEGTECVVRLPQRDLKGGNGRSSLLQNSPRLIHVELRRRSDSESLLGKGQDPLLNSHVVLRDSDSLLGNAILHVIRGDVGEQGHEGIVVVLDRCIQTGIGGFNRAAKAAPEIELPAQVEASLEIVKEGLGKNLGIGQVPGKADPRIRPGQLVSLGEDLPGRDRLLSAGFENSRTGDTYSRALFARPVG